ncbi:MAG TPA: hypothetical protein VKD90_05150 [Gemmataceae bacterium]|nr:hypothetical protein [Gemmataceae bacterium]
MNEHDDYADPDSVPTPESRHGFWLIIILFVLFLGVLGIVFLLSIPLRWFMI